MTEQEQIWQAQLRDMPWEAVVRFVEEQGWVVGIGEHTRNARHPIVYGWCVPELDTRPDRLPPGYPPDEGALPFEVDPSSKVS